MNDSAERKELPEAAPPPEYLKSQHQMIISSMQQHPSGFCEDRVCPEAWEAKPSTYNAALAHAQDTGHTVRLEETTLITMEVMGR